MTTLESKIYYHSVLKVTFVTNVTKKQYGFHKNIKQHVIMFSGHNYLFRTILAYK